MRFSASLNNPGRLVRRGGQFLFMAEKEKLAEAGIPVAEESFHAGRRPSAPQLETLDAFAGNDL